MASYPCFIFYSDEEDARHTSVWMYLMQMAMEADSYMGGRQVFPYRPGDLDDDTLQRATAAWQAVCSWRDAQNHATGLQDWLPIMRASMAQVL